MSSIATSITSITNSYTGIGIQLFVSVSLLAYAVRELMKVLIHGELYLLVWLRGKLHGIPTVCVDDPALAMEVIRKSLHKGDFIESQVSRRAWLPLMSIESEDDENWAKLRSKFDSFHATLSLPKLQELTNLATDEYVNKRLDSPTLCRMLIKIFLEWTSNGKPATEKLITLVASGVEEWRKEIALKGRADAAIKEEFVATLESYYQMKDISYILQPFIISPVINMTDILCTRGATSVEEAIVKSHPFPFLERYVNEDIGPIKAGTQVFIPLSQMAKIHGDAWMAFSVGKRGCPGRQAGMIMLKTILDKFQNLDNFVPEVGHKHSGRNNDNGVGPVFFYLETVIRGLVSRRS